MNITLGTHRFVFGLVVVAIIAAVGLSLAGSQLVDAEVLAEAPSSEEEGTNAAAAIIAAPAVAAPVCEESAGRVCEPEALVIRCAATTTLQISEGRRGDPSVYYGPSGVNAADVRSCFDIIDGLTSTTTTEVVLQINGVGVASTPLDAVNAVVDLDGAGIDYDNLGSGDTGSVVITVNGESGNGPVTVIITLTGGVSTDD